MDCGQRVLLQGAQVDFSFLSVGFSSLGGLWAGGSVSGVAAVMFSEVEVVIRLVVLLVIWETDPLAKPSTTMTVFP